MLEFPDWIFKEFLRPENIYFDEDTQKMRLNLVERNFSINRKFDHGYRLINLIGIAVCLHPKFISYTFGLNEKSICFVEDINSEISREIIDNYHNNPKIVEKVSGILDKAERRYKVNLGDSNIPPELYS